MTPILETALILHVLFGLFGIFFFAAVGLSLLKKKNDFRLLAMESFFGFLSIALAWISGGYYYVTHYGKQVKPVINAGPYPWAHSIFMEWKEHLFLFLPFLSFIVFVALALGSFKKENPWTREIAGLTWMIVILGIIMTLSGVLISGAAQPL